MITELSKLMLFILSLLMLAIVLLLLPIYAWLLLAYKVLIHCYPGVELIRSSQQGVPLWVWTESTQNRNVPFLSWTFLSRAVLVLGENFFFFLTGATSSGGFKGTVHCTPTHSHSTRLRYPFHIITGVQVIFIIICIYYSYIHILHIIL
jgi:hypothetical protein